MQRCHDTTFCRNARGTTSVEYALVVPVLLAMMLAIIDFAWLTWTVDAVQQGASAGARCMSVLGSSCTSNGVYSSTVTTGYVQKIVATRGVSLASASVALNNSTTCGATSGFSKVTIRYTFQTVVPNILNAFGTQPSVNVVACFPNQTS